MSWEPRIHSSPCSPAHEWMSHLCLLSILEGRGRVLWVKPCAPSPLPAPIPEDTSCLRDQLCLLGLLWMEESSAWLPYTPLYSQTHRSKTKYVPFPWELGQLNSSKDSWLPFPPKASESYSPISCSSAPRLSCCPRSRLYGQCPDPGGQQAVWLRHQTVSLTPTSCDPGQVTSSLWASGFSSIKCIWPGEPQKSETCLSFAPSTVPGTYCWLDECLMTE